MENMLDYLSKQIELQQHTIERSKELLKVMEIPALIDFHHESIAKAEAKIVVYEEMLEKVLEFEKHGSVLPF